MDFEKYENKMPYPVAPIDPRNVNIRNMSPDILTELAKKTSAYQRELVNFKLERKEYFFHDADLRNQFRDDCLAEVGLHRHPNAYGLFEFAKEHAGDTMQDVYNFLSDLAQYLGSDFL